MKRTNTVHAIIATLVTLFLAIAPANAQMGGGMGLAEPFSSEDVSDMGAYLDMTDEQIATVRDMHQAYFAAFQEDRETLTQAIQAIIQEAQEAGDMSGYSEIGEMVWAFEKSSQKNLDRLFEDIKLILSEEQLDRWPAYEVRAYRKRTLPTVSGQGMSISGASTDLIDIYEHRIDERLEDEELEETVESILAQYGREMNTALKNFSEVRRKTTEESLEIGMNWMNNMGKLEDIIGRYIEAAVQIRDINDRYVGRVAAALPQDLRETWEDRYNRTASPSVYSPNYINESFETALELKDLTEEQRTRINDLRARHASSAKPINKKWDEALRQSQESFSIQAMMSGQTTSAEANEFRDERRELDASTYDSLASILTDAQAENLPDKPVTNWRDRFQFSNGN